MRYAIALAAIPVPLLMWAAWPKAASPIEVRAVATEGVRTQRQDTETFRARWRPLYDVPPATVVHEVPVRVAASHAPPPVRLMRRAALRVNGICAKHGMRKVEYLRRGYKHWRCRR